MKAVSLKINKIVKSFKDDLYRNKYKVNLLGENNFYRWVASSYGIFLLLLMTIFIISTFVNLLIEMHSGD